MAGYAIVIVLLVAGVAGAIRRLDAVDARTEAHIRAKEQEIALTERLRWRNEVVVSSASGYLLSRDPIFLARLREADAAFDEDLAALERRSPTPIEQSLFAEIERVSSEYRRAQEDLLAETQLPVDPRELGEHFETLLQPRRVALAGALDGFARHKQEVIAGVYAEAQRDRRHLLLWTQGLLGVVMLVSLAIAWTFSRQLARVYAKEQQALDAAQKALAARDEIMGVVAHDLRNPLGAITMKAAVLRQEASSEKTRRQAESIENIGMRMEYLIRSMLDVTVLEAGRLTVSPAPCSADGLLREATDLFSGVATSKGIQLARGVEEPGILVRADHDRVLQVLSNLLGNALKFTPKGGRITMSVERRNSSARFAVSDTGPGIARDHVSHVFDRFWRPKESTKAGTGLGLFIARGIVEAHGGRIWVESDPGHGATFYFSMPLAEAEVSTIPLNVGQGAPNPA